MEHVESHLPQLSRADATRGFDPLLKAPRRWYTQRLEGKGRLFAADMHDGEREQGMAEEPAALGGANQRALREEGVRNNPFRDQGLRVKNQDGQQQSTSV